MVESQKSLQDSLLGLLDTGIEISCQHYHDQA